MTSPSNHRVLLHGLGVEGAAALEWFLEHQTDRLAVIDTPEKLAGLYTNENIKPYTEESFPIEMFSTFDLYLRSPGIPPSNTFVQQAEAHKLSITTPTGYWLQHLAPPSAITVTGTKGKSTTTSLITACLVWIGLNGKAYGNIGKPPLAVDHQENEIPILELSSYMMHDLPLTGHYHIITNLYTEHTPWHGTVEAYQAAKLRPFLDNPAQAGLISRQVADATNIRSRNIDIIEDVVGGGPLTLELAGEFLKPADYNDAFTAPSMVAALRTAVAAILRTQNTNPHELHAALKTNLASWKGLPSRQFVLATQDDCIWVDDALATVPEATASAMARWHKGRMHLLLGGKDRGQSFDELLTLTAERGDVTVYAFSDTAEKVAHTANLFGVPCTKFDDMEEALAALSPQAGDVILFSPSAPTASKHGNYTVRSSLFADRAHQHRPKVN